MLISLGANCPRCDWPNDMSMITYPIYICRACNFGRKEWMLYGRTAYTDNQYHTAFCKLLKETLIKKEVDELCKLPDNP